MNKHSTYQTSTYTIPAGGSMFVDRAAGFLICLDASHPFKIRLGTGPISEFEAGLTLRPEGGFERLEIQNIAAADLSVKFGFGQGDVQDARLTISGTVGTRAEVPMIFNGDMAPLAVGATSSVAALAENAYRAEAGITNTGDARLWVKSVNSTSTGGQPIDPGQSVVLSTTAAIYVANATATAGEIARWETEQSA